ncbi:MAG: hypothetical protein R3362_12180, partial [Rhodothermales bacterium]|nr:hypothetical protein [Rhodothermales bacterium]
TPEEVLAFEWAIQAYVPLAQPAPHPWLLTTYEGLVREGPAELERIFAYLGEPVPEAARAGLRAPSATTVTDSNVARGRDPLAGWRKKLDAEAVDSILRVAHAVGVRGYTDDLEPDYDTLFHAQFDPGAVNEACGS